MDVVFAVDSSRRADERMLVKMKKMVTASLRSYKIAPTETRAAIVTFGSKPEIKVNLISGVDRGAVQKSVDQIVAIGGSRRMNKAMRTIRTEIFEKEENRRGKSKKMLILLTTGKNSGDGSGELPSVASELRAGGVEVIALVIGKEKDAREIEIITGKKDNAVYVDDISMLPKAIGAVEAKTREAGGMYNKLFTATFANFVTQNSNEIYIPFLLPLFGYFSLILVLTLY